MDSKNGRPKSICPAYLKSNYMLIAGVLPT